MKIEMRDLVSIIPYHNNPRHNDNAINHVASSIEEFGFRQPIVVDKHDIIIIGHTRYLAAQKLELHQVPVHVAHTLSESQAKALRIKDNKTSEFATWDYELLPIELNSIVGEHDIETLGFNLEELKKILNDPTCDFGPGAENEQGRLDKKNPIECPHCHQEFIPK